MCRGFPGAATRPRDIENCDRRLIFGADYTPYRQKPCRRTDSANFTVFSTVEQDFAATVRKLYVARRKSESLGLPMTSNAVQHSENVRNSLGLN
jgi:hypothetical protein